jgi:HEAT repeat protein
VPQLAAGLQHQDPSVQYAAVCALGRIRDPWVSRALMPAFRSDRPEIAALAIRGAIAQDEPWMVPRLMTEFGWRDTNRLLVGRVVAAADLIGHGWLGGIPVLFKVMKENTPTSDEVNREWDKRERVAWEKELSLEALSRVLGQDFGYNENAPAGMQSEIVARMEDHYAKHCADVHARAHKIDDPHLIALVRRLIGGLNTFQLRNIDDARFLLESLGPPVADFLIEGTRANEFYIRYHCLEVLGRFREEASAADRQRISDAIAPLAGDQDNALREMLATTLGELCSPDSVPTLEKLLGDPELGVRTATILALGRCGSPAALRLLAQRFPPEAAQTSEQVAALAAQIELGSEPALEPYLLGLSASDPDVRATTSDLLSTLVGNGLRQAAGSANDAERILAEARRYLRERYLSEPKGSS